MQPLCFGLGLEGFLIFLPAWGEGSFRFAWFIVYLIVLTLFPREGKRERRRERQREVAGAVARQRRELYPVCASCLYLDDGGERKKGRKEERGKERRWYDEGELRDAGEGLRDAR